METTQKFVIEIVRSTAIKLVETLGQLEYALDQDSLHRDSLRSLEIMGEHSAILESCRLYNVSQNLKRNEQPRALLVVDPAMKKYSVVKFREDRNGLPVIKSTDFIKENAS